MIKKCDFCNTLTEDYIKIEKYVCCLRCERKMKNAETNEEPPTIKLEIDHYYEASFQPVQNTIRISKFSNMPRLFTCINHEQMHKTLFLVDGFKTSTLYDNVSQRGELDTYDS